MKFMATVKLVGGGAFLLLGLAFADQTAPAPVVPPPAGKTPAPQRRGSGRYRRPTLDDRIAALSKNLNLTEIQRSAVKKILEQRQEDTVRIRNSDVPGNVRIEQFRALQERAVAQIRAVLTDEQKKHYDPLLPRTRPAPETPQRSVEDWIKATTPH